MRIWTTLLGTPFCGCPTFISRSHLRSRPGPLRYHLWPYSGLRAFQARCVLLVILYVMCVLEISASCSYAVRRLYRSFVQILVSLWRLFRGNKFNPLRNRVDTCIYTLDELFVGTLAFVIACYLVPSVAAYHYFFSVCMYCADIIEAVLWLVYACIFSFPIAPPFSWCFFPSKDEKEITIVNNSPVIIVNIFSYFTFRYYILLYCINV